MAARLASSKHPAFDYTVVDEAQDIKVAQLRFLSALGAARPNSLFFAEEKQGKTGTATNNCRHKPRAPSPLPRGKPVAQSLFQHRHIVRA
jgi:hypothetical protein